MVVTVHSGNWKYGFASVSWGLREMEFNIEEWSKFGKTVFYEFVHYFEVWYWHCLEVTSGKELQRPDSFLTIMQTFHPSEFLSSILTVWSVKSFPKTIFSHILEPLCK